jgi:anion-transporting  ArsA/GET3 family ATPase
MNQETVCLEAIFTLNALVEEYLNEFNMRPKPKDVGIPLTKAEKAAEAMLNASSADDLTNATVTTAIRRTVGVMRDIEQDLISHDLSKYIERRKKVEQLGSIMHIGRAYPESAVKRLKLLKPEKVSIKAA